MHKYVNYDEDMVSPNEIVNKNGYHTTPMVQMSQQTCPDLSSVIIDVDCRRGAVPGYPELVILGSPFVAVPRPRLQYLDSQYIVLYSSSGATRCFAGALC